MKKMIGFLFPLTAILVALLGPREAIASFHLGQQLNHSLSVCLKKEDAIEILEKEAKEGHAAASAVWNAKDECITLPVTGVTVGKVVFSLKVERQGKKLTGSVVELIHDGKVVAYFLTTAPVSAIKQLGQAGSDKEV